MSNHQRFLGVLIALTSAWLAACDHHSSAPLSPSSALTSVQITNWEVLQGGIPVGWTTQLTAKASFGDGTTRDVTTDAAWASSDPSVITVAAGVAVVHGGGRVMITAAYQGVTGSNNFLVTPFATPPGLDLWQLTTTVASITGQSAECSTGVGSVGSSGNSMLGIRRTGSSISFDSDVIDPTDDTHVTGTVTGSDFVADGTFGNQIRCRTGKIFNWRSTRLTGRFDQSGRSLTARVIWSWVNAESGDAITLAYDWAATAGPTAAASLAK